MADAPGHPPKPEKVIGYSRSLSSQLLCFLRKFQYCFNPLQEKAGWIISQSILSKVWVIFIIAVIFFPCFVESSEFATMNVQSKLMSGIPLNGEVFCQGFDKSCTKFAVVVFDGFNGIVETGTEHFPGFNSLFSSATP